MSQRCPVGNVVEVSFRTRIRRKAKDYVEFRRQVFALLLHNNVINYELYDWN